MNAVQVDPALIARLRDQSLARKAVEQLLDGARLEVWEVLP
jgi:hypothetical protein